MPSRGYMLRLIQIYNEQGLEGINRHVEGAENLLPFALILATIGMCVLAYDFIKARLINK